MSVVTFGELIDRNDDLWSLIKRETEDFLLLSRA